MSEPVSDIRAVPQRVLDLYLYPLGGWGVALGLLYLQGWSQLALLLLQLLALWQIGLTAWWGRDMLRRHGAGQLSQPEVGAGVRSVGQILAWSALTPAIVFLATDPLSPETLGTVIGNAVVAAAAWGVVVASLRVMRRVTGVLALTAACAALPINAAGAVTVATLSGWWTELVEHTPLPDAVGAPRNARDGDPGAGRRDRSGEGTNRDDRPRGERTQDGARDGSRGH